MRAVFAAIPVCLSVSIWAQTAACSCDPSNPSTFESRDCSLCQEAEKQPKDIGVFFLKDINPRKPNRWLALPREHAPAKHRLESLSEASRTALWTAAIEKAKSMWGDQWAVAYNGDRVRTQCHTHIHLGRLIPGVEAGEFVVVDGPAKIPVPGADGLWIHPHQGKLHVHTGDQIAETVLLR